MIDFIRGKIVKKTSNNLILEKQGVGFKVLVPSPASFCSAHQEVTLYTHLYLRDDEIILFGFATLEEKELFIMLQKVAGVGPKGALAVLKSLSCTNFYQAVLQDNISALTKIPGVGPKSAKRIILELKEKISTEKLKLEEDNLQNLSGNVWHNVAEALEGLGYSQDEITRAYESMNRRYAASGQKMDWHAEDLLREMLSFLSRG